jgi:carbonic anhydrase
MIHDAETKLESDVLSLQNNPMLKEGVQVFGAVYDVDTGEVNWIDNP